MVQVRNQAILKSYNRAWYGPVVDFQDDEQDPGASKAKIQDNAETKQQFWFCKVRVDC